MLTYRAPVEIQLLVVEDREEVGCGFTDLFFTKKRPLSRKIKKTFDLFNS